MSKTKQIRITLTRDWESDNHRWGGWWWSRKMKTPYGNRRLYLCKDEVEQHVHIPKTARQLHLTVTKAPPAKLSNVLKIVVQFGWKPVLIDDCPTDVFLAHSAEIALLNVVHHLYDGTVGVNIMSDLVTVYIAFEYA